MTQKEIDCQKRAVEAHLNQDSFTQWRAWDTWNYILNTVRQAAGKPLRDRLSNPYMTAEVKRNIEMEKRRGDGKTAR